MLFSMVILKRKFTWSLHPVLLRSLDPRYVWLKILLYGLKQSPRACLIGLHSLWRVRAIVKDRRITLSLQKSLPKTTLCLGRLWTGGSHFLYKNLYQRQFSVLIVCRRYNFDRGWYRRNESIEAVFSEGVWDQGFRAIEMFFENGNVRSKRGIMVSQREYTLDLLKEIGVS